MRHELTTLQYEISPETSLSDLALVYHMDCLMKSFIQYDATGIEQRSAQNHFHCRQMRLSPYNGRANALLSSSACCQQRGRRREFGTMKDRTGKTHSSNKTEPLVTRNAMEIVSSAPRRTSCIHIRISRRDRYCAHSRAIARRRSKDLKGSSCHGN